MVKNKGFLPSGPSEIPIQRNQIKEIIYSLLPACKDPDIDSGIPFKADAIIANPPAYGEILSYLLIYNMAILHSQPIGFRWNLTRYQSRVSLKVSFLACLSDSPINLIWEDIPS